LAQSAPPLPYTTLFRSAAPDALPTFARLYAYTPVSGAWRDLPAVLVGTPPTFTLTASNGWTVSLVPQAPAFRVDGTNASVTYKRSEEHTSELQSREKLV